MSTVQDVINKVSQDTRLQLSSTQAPGLNILIDYTNRIHKQVLRFSRWPFMLSEPQYFMTSKGQTDYWIGPNNALPINLVPTSLDLKDVAIIKKDSVRDISNDRPLKFVGERPLGPSLNYRSGQTRQGAPAQFYQNSESDPNILHIYPGADNSNTFKPVPTTPALIAATGGALAQRTYFVRVTFVDSLAGESDGSSVSAQIVVPLNQLCTVLTPSLDFDFTASGVQYGWYNIYMSNTEGTETLQNSTPISIGTNWTEPSTGIISTGVSVPTQNTLAQMQGYIITFRYYKVRMVLANATDVLQVPDKYQDVVVNGVDALVSRLLGQPDAFNAFTEAYKGGLTEMVWDKNLFPDTDFIRPDPNTYVNQQILGYWPPFL
jgi:hypothetical protein